MSYIDASGSTHANKISITVRWRTVIYQENHATYLSACYMMLLNRCQAHHTNYTNVYTRLWCDSWHANGGVAIKYAVRQNYEDATKKICWPIQCTQPNTSNDCANLSSAVAATISHAYWPCNEEHPNSFRTQILSSAEGRSKG